LEMDGIDHRRTGGCHAVSELPPQRMPVAYPRPELLHPPQATVVEGDDVFLHAVSLQCLHHLLLDT